MRPNNEISVHYRFFEVQASKVLIAIARLTKKDSLDENDIQAVKGLLDVYAELTSDDIGAYFRRPSRENHARTADTK